MHTAHEACDKMLWQAEDNRAMVALTGKTPHRAIWLWQVKYHSIGAHNTNTTQV